MRTAARQFAQRGVGGIRLDELADVADIARGTLYNHFRTKDDLLEAIMTPVVDASASQAQSLAQLAPREAVMGIVELYLQLWHEHQDALRVAFQRQDGTLGALVAGQRAFSRAVLAIFSAAADAGILRASRAETAALSLRRVAVPLLEAFADEPDDGMLFRASLSALLLRPAALGA